MTDMRAGRLNRCPNGGHTACTLRVRVAHCPPPPVARKLSYPSWKVIVSASHGQYLKPGSHEPGFFSVRCVTHCSAPVVDPIHARLSITNPCPRRQSSRVRANRSALAITLTEDSAIAAAPTI